MNEIPVTTYPDRDSWLKARMAGISSSDAAAVLGVSPWKSPFTLYAEKLGLVDTDAEESEAMRWGTLLEPVIATRYGEETQRPLHDPGRFTLRQSPRHPFMLATLDREILTPNERGVVGVLEIKTTGQFRVDEWAEEPPVYYQVQVQHQLAVTGYAWGSLAVLIGGQRFLWVDIERRDDFIALLVEREAAFWDRVQRLDPPTPDATSKDILHRLYPKDTGASIALPAEALEWDRRLLEAKDQLKRWESVKDECEALLKGAIGQASVGVLTDGTRYQWKASERKGYVVEATSVRSLRRLKG